MSALAGFILGYVLGTKQGPKSYEKLLDAWHAISESPEVKALLERLPSMGDLATTGADTVVGQLRGILEKASGGGASEHDSHADAGAGESSRPYSGNGVKAVEALFAGGMSLFGTLVERGMTMMRERQAHDSSHDDHE